jgi:diguanylate cyclase (GGDEF)-like protein
MDTVSLQILAVICVVLAVSLAIGMVAFWRQSRHAARRSREFKLLAEIGSVLSSRLVPDEVLAAVQKELAKFLDTSAFYVAFVDEANDRVRFEFETEDGVVVPKRERTQTQGFTEYIIRTGKPLLIDRNLERVRDELGVMRIARPAKCFCGVPIRIKDKVTGAMAVLNYYREDVFSQHDVEILQVAARHVAVAFENAQMFAAEQRRTRYLQFINSLSKTAISSQNADEMLAAIVGQIHKTFHFDHFCIGIIDLNAKEIEIRAAAGTDGSNEIQGRRFPLGAGVMGRAARSGETVLEQGLATHPDGVLGDACSILSVPLTYSDSRLGVMNVESRAEHAFRQDEVMMLQTLGDLLAAALHNVFVYQKMEQQSITDPLTGIKTRRFFDEALQSEFKRGMRSGRPFCVVLIDLDKFKQVNDGQGHLEGDLVLARIGRLLEQKVRQSNIVARYGGDEFVILMPETSVDQACALSERLRLWIATDPFLKEKEITGSFGVAEFPLHGNSVEDIVRMADAGMYMSKRAGANKVSSADPVQDANTPQGEQRKVLASYLEGLLRREHFASETEIIGALQKIKAAVAPADVDDALRNAIRMITRAIETRELHATGHGEAVASYVAAMAGELPFSAKERADLIFAAHVHDVGKIVIPEYILTKPGTLTFSEFQMMKSHPAVGSKIVAVLPDSDNIQKYVHWHQEHMNGAGYPDGISGDQIPLGARVIGVAEAFVNIISNKPYAEGLTPAEAMGILERGCPEHFDPQVVRVLVQQLKGAKAAAVQS